MHPSSLIIQPPRVYELSLADAEEFGQSLTLRYLPQRGRGQGAFQGGHIQLSLCVASITNALFSSFPARYIYPLDSSTWIEYWPTDTACPSCPTFLATLEEFSEDIFLNGCENA